jgi:hypothetical protein
MYNSFNVHILLPGVLLHCRDLLFRLNTVVGLSVAVCSGMIKGALTIRPYYSIIRPAQSFGNYADSVLWQGIHRADKTAVCAPINRPRSWSTCLVITRVNSNWRPFKLIGAMLTERELFTIVAAAFASSLWFGIN